MKQLLTFFISILFCVSVFATNIYNGDGTDYPNGIDSYTRQSAASYWTYPKQNDIAELGIAIITELGTNPKGGYNTVKDRLNAFKTSTGTMRTDIDTNTSDISAVKISTGNIYSWDSGTGNITKQPDYKIIFSTAITSYNEKVTTITINGINEIKSVQITTIIETIAQNIALYYVYTTSFTLYNPQSENIKKFTWQAIVR